MALIFSEKLQVLRKLKGFTQEELGERLSVSRQAVAKWEAGQAYPDIVNLIGISELLNVTVDYLVKNQDCSVGITRQAYGDLDALITFRLEANAKTYAAMMNEVPSTRLDSHDYRYDMGEFTYHDTYVGGEQFAGQEAIWKNGSAVYAMNYVGRVLHEKFSGKFLKDALKAADKKMPFRGPAWYQSGEYIYQAKVTGDVDWFQGYETICWQAVGEGKNVDDINVYECYFHGGLIK